MKMRYQLGMEMTMMKLEDVLQIPLAPLTAQQIREHVVEMNSTLLRNIENGQWKLLYMVCQGNANLS